MKLVLRHSRPAIVSAIAAVAAIVFVTSTGSQPAVHYRKIGDTPGFPGLRRELRRIVDTAGRSELNTFCLMIADTGDKDPLAYAIWRERGLMYRWHQTTEAQVNDEALVLHGPLNLRKDLVRTRADRASTYLVTRAWVRDVEQQCREHGEIIQIVRDAK